MTETNLKQKFWIDTDCGVDDAHAIFIALAHPDVEVVGISTVAGNTSAAQAAKNVLRVLKAANRLEVGDKDIYTCLIMMSHMSVMASQIAGNSTAYSTACSGQQQQGNNQRGICRWPDWQRPALKLVLTWASCWKTVELSVIWDNMPLMLWNSSLQIPVHIGVEKSLLGNSINASYFHGHDGLGDTPDPSAPDPSLIQKEHAVTAMTRAIKQNSGRTLQWRHMRIITS